MLTYHNRYVPWRNFLCFIVESVGIFVSVFLAYYLLSSRLDNNMISLHDIAYRGFAITLFAQFCLYILDLYDMKIAFTVPEIFFSVTFTTGLFYIAIGVFILTIRDFYIEKNIFYLAGLFVFVFLIGWRLTFHSYINSQPYATNVLILGSGERASEVAELVQSSRRLGFNLVGTVGKYEGGEAGRSAGPSPEYSLRDLKATVEKANIHQIIVAQEDKRGHLPIKELLDLKVNGIDVVEWPEFVENLAGKIPVKALPPSFFVFNGGFGVNYASKRISELFSFAFSLVSSILLLPFFLVVGVLIKLDSEGPVLYRQKRVGEKGRRFDLIKFRTMIKDAESHSGAVWARDGDPRITLIGRYLRRFRIDELPQFLNVVKGDMNVVGPRPERPEFVQVLEDRIPYYSIRHSIKPGITGWAQVKGSYSGTIEESRDKLEYDLFYLKNKSFKFDLFIIFKTVKTLILGRGAR
jgi:sugar transferase (PEP-CTERM system associated)